MVIDTALPYDLEPRHMGLILDHSSPLQFMIISNGIIDSDNDILIKIMMLIVMLKG